MAICLGGAGAALLLLVELLHQFSVTLLVVAKEGLVVSLVLKCFVVGGLSGFQGLFSLLGGFLSFGQFGLSAVELAKVVRELSVQWRGRASGGSCRGGGRVLVCLGCGLCLAQGQDGLSHGLGRRLEVRMRALSKLFADLEEGLELGLGKGFVGGSLVPVVRGRL
jgi:hypothetical protein